MTELKNHIKTTSKYIKILEENGIKSARDLLTYFPRTYEDRSNMKTLDELSQDMFFFKDKKKQSIMTKGQIIKKSIFSRGGKRIYDIQFIDTKGNKGYISIYNANFLASKITENNRYIIIGKPSFKFSKIIFSHPEVILTTHDEEESKSDYNTGRLYPIYSELAGIKPSRFASKIRGLIDKVDIFFEEYLPDEFLEKFNLLNIVDTIKNIHYPINFEINNKALHRIFFDRILKIQLYSIINKNNYQNSHPEFLDLIPEEPHRDIIKNIIDNLPFELTNAQKKVTKNIIEDLHSPKSMLRLLQGDVGSGKTIVAAISAYYTNKKFNGQSVFLAPLEVLANQHYRTLSKLLLPLGLRTELLTGSLTKDQKDKIKSDLKLGKIHVLIGTHAVLQEDIEFKKLDFAVIDEQHKFGVKQRAFFKKFGSPNILQMSATPIPRSMALAFFGEFDVSIIDELPVGRQPIYTKIISEKEYYDKKFKMRIMDKINKGEKVFIVTPLIDESEKMEDLKAAKTEFEDVRRRFGDKENENILQGQQKERKEDKLTEKVIGIALKIYHSLGPKLREQTYRNALVKLLEKEGFKVEVEKKISYKIEGEQVGYGMIDIIVNGELALELKSIPRINSIDYKQLRAYIKQSNNIERGLLLNFGSGSFDFRRMLKNEEKMVSKSTSSLLDPSRIGLLHGKMKPKEKEEIMSNFKSGKISILVSTTVIEVGVDIPEATIMVIKNSERFGLSQLHQLRGRIGRSNLKSYCFLETKTKSGDTYKRLKSMEETNDGFKLAEMDLQQRGPGEILGTMQSGETDIPLEILSDIKFLEQVQDGARRLLEKYPNLKGLDKLKEQLKDKLGDIMA